MRFRPKTIKVLRDCPVRKAANEATLEVAESNVPDVMKFPSLLPSNTPPSRSHRRLHNAKKILEWEKTR